MMYKTNIIDLKKVTLKIWFRNSNSPRLYLFEVIALEIIRVFTETQDFKSLIIQLLEKEVDKLISATYNDRQVGKVAFKSGGRKE